MLAPDVNLRKVEMPFRSHFIRTARRAATEFARASLIASRPFRTALIPALALAPLLCAGPVPARAQSAAREGQEIAFDRGKGNCLTCHEIKGGDLPGTIGPKLENIKSKYPDRNDLVAIVTDETKRNPQTVMPPFGRNRILTEQEINAVVDFLQTL
jgi:L-cysteine S-thiosulfotransferase